MSDVILPWVVYGGLAAVVIGMCLLLIFGKTGLEDER